jgi:hypothetical protein
MHQNTFLTAPDVKKLFFNDLILEMHQNTFLTTPDVKKQLSKDLILVVQKCIKTRFSPLQTLKNIFFKDLILVVWKYAQMH